MTRSPFWANPKKPGRRVPNYLGDTSRTGVPEHFSLLIVKRQVKRVPDCPRTRRDTHRPKRVRGGWSLKRPPADVRAAVRALVGDAQ